MLRNDASFTKRSVICYKTKLKWWTSLRHCWTSVCEVFIVGLHVCVCSELWQTSRLMTTLSSESVVHWLNGTPPPNTHTHINRITQHHTRPHLSTRPKSILLEPHSIFMSILHLPKVTPSPPGPPIARSKIKGLGIMMDLASLLFKCLYLATLWFGIDWENSVFFHLELFSSFVC